MSVNRKPPSDDLRATVVRAVVGYPSHYAREIAKFQGFEMYYCGCDNNTIVVPAPIRENLWNICVHVITEGNQLVVRKAM